MELRLLSADLKIKRLSLVIRVGPIQSQGSLKVEEGGRRSGCSQKFEDVMLLDLKMEEGATSQGMQVKDKETGPSLELSEAQPC